MAKYSEDVIAQARRLYVEEGRAVRQISQLLNVPTATIHYWVKNRKWKEVREEMAGSARSIYEMGVKILRGKLKELADMPAGKVSPAMLDGLNKLMRTVESARENVRVFECAVIAGEDFVPFVRKQIPDEQSRAIVFQVWEAFLDSVKE